MKFFYFKIYFILKNRRRVGDQSAVKWVDVKFKRKKKPLDDRIISFGLISEILINVGSVQLDSDLVQQITWAKSALEHPPKRLHKPRAPEDRPNRKKMGTLGRAIYTVGNWIRGTGQALDRVGSLLQGSHRLEEHRKPHSNPRSNPQFILLWFEKLLVSFLPYLIWLFWLNSIEA